jgi:uncharacterized alpha-E superfamily protein
MLARIAHQLYWIGRYIARADATARMLEGVSTVAVQARPRSRTDMRLSWDSLLAIMGVPVDDDSPTRETVIQRLVLAEDQDASIVASVRAGRELARTVREVISADMWEVINTLHLELRDVDVTSLRAAPHSLYELVKSRVALFWGVQAQTMLRDEAHAFLEAGHQLESATMMVRMLRVSLREELSDADPSSTIRRDEGAVSLLLSTGGLDAFRRLERGPHDAASVARFLLGERTYPHSVAAALDVLRDSLDEVDSDPRRSPPLLRLARLSAEIEFRGGGGVADDVGGLLFDVQDELAQTDGELAERYFVGTERYIVGSDILHPTLTI